MSASTSPLAPPAFEETERRRPAGLFFGLARPDVRSVAGTVLATVVTLATVGLGLDFMGAGRRPALFILLGVGAVVAQLVPGHRRAVAVATGVVALVGLNPLFGVAFTALIAGLASCRRRAVPFVSLLLGATIVFPKMAFARHYAQPGFWNWLNEPSLALAIFASVLWAHHRADRRTQNEGSPDDVTSFLLLYLMPAHAAFPMAFSPRMLAKHERGPADGAPDLGAVAGLLGWFALKVATLVVLRRLAPHGFLRDVVGGDAARWGRGTLWGIVLASYLELYLVLAASADVPVLIARLYGWSLPAPFRAALLASTPVELWRRWGIYNRHILLQIVYFPLGGGKRHRDRNVLLTFLASALLLHSGWFGSKYWVVGAGGWRDETLYFLLQGIAVCACLRFQPAAAPGAKADGWRWLPGRFAGIAITQGWSALVHVIVLAQGIDLATRGRLIARCLGL